jgi:hypothetical protein
MSVIYKNKLNAVFFRTELGNEPVREWLALKRKHQYEQKN